MKILFCVRHNFHDSPGGAQIQILKTKAYLEKKGVVCDLTTTPYGVDFNEYDIVHLTDLTWVYDLLLYLKKLKGFKGKKVLSTIYWPFDDYASNGAPLLQKIIFKIFGINGFEYAKAIAKFIMQKESVYLQGLKKSYIQNQINIVNEVNWLLPNSKMEMEALNNRLGLELENFTVVNNAIDTSVFDKILDTNKIEKKNDLITFVARIDPRKNQLTFLEAMQETSYRIRFIGNAAPNCKKYYQKLKQVAAKRGNVEFIYHITQEEVFKHMMEAKVNVLTSWIETPGLVSLEAGYAGCNIVVSDKGSVRDYFKDYAFYCLPDDVNSIRIQTIRAMESGYDESFRALIKKDFDWSKTAEQTYKGYQNVLND
jgi:glycosyltransferase involved in cell wall biosynthesis